MSDFLTPWTVAYQAPPSMGFSRQEYWSGSPFPSPGDLPDPRDWNEVSCIVGRCFTVWATCELDQSECWRINALELWCWRRLPVLKEINPDYSLEGLRLKLKFQYSGYLIQRADWLEKTPMLGKIWGQEEKGATEDEIVGWHHQLSGHEFEQSLGDSEVQGRLVCYSLWGQK